MKHIFIFLFFGGILPIFSLPAAERGRLQLSFEDREVPLVRFQGGPLNPIISDPTSPSVNPKAVIRWNSSCNWKSWELQSRPEPASGAWETVPFEDLLIEESDREVQVVDLRPLGPSRFYQLKVQAIADILPLHSFSSPAVPFESDVAVDEKYVYYGSGHGELFRAPKNGEGPPERIATLNFSKLLAMTLQATGVEPPESFLTLNAATTTANDLAVLGVAVDQDNIYFSVNKVVRVDVQLTEQQREILGGIDKTFNELPDAPITVFAFVPKTGAIFFLPKALLAATELTGQSLQPIPLALGLDGAAGIATDATHLYWSCLGSHVDEVELAEFAIGDEPDFAVALLNAWIAGDQEGAQKMIDEKLAPLAETGLTAALTTVLVGMPPFEKNGAIFRRVRPQSSPDILAGYVQSPENLTPENLLLLAQPERVKGELALPSRRILVDGDFIHFGENGAILPLVSYGPADGGSGLRKVPKSGGEVVSLTGTNKMPAFTLSREGNDLAFGAYPPVVGGLLGIVLKGVSLFGSVNVWAVDTGEALTIIPGLIFSCTSQIEIRSDDVFFNNTTFGMEEDGAINRMRKDTPFSVTPPIVLPRRVEGTGPRPSTFAMDDCAIYVTTSDRGTNTIKRVIVNLP